MKAGKKIQRRYDQRLAGYNQLAKRLRPEDLKYFTRPGSRKKH